MTDKILIKIKIKKRVEILSNAKNLFLFFSRSQSTINITANIWNKNNEIKKLEIVAKKK
jgi:hypothetical protein